MHVRFRLRQMTLYMSRYSAKSFVTTALLVIQIGFTYYQVGPYNEREHH